MGFINSLEREREREISLWREQVERERVASIEKQKEEIDKEALNNEQEVYFLQANESIIDLLALLKRYGYREYFNKIQALSSFVIKPVLYTQGVMQLNISGRKPERGIALALREAADNSGFFRFSGQLNEYSEDASTQFLGDNVRTSWWRGVDTEKTEAGIGFSFSRKVDEKHYKRIKTVQDFSQGRLRYVYAGTKTIYGAFYARARVPNNITVTGANIQREVDLRDLEAFDQVLERVSRQLFIPAFIKTNEQLVEWPGSNYESPGFGGE